MDDERHLTPETVRQALDLLPSIIDILREQVEAQPRRLYYRDETPSEQD